MKADYQKPDRGWCGDPSRGAAMGRLSDLKLDTTAELTIRAVPLDDDYDPGGTYWGSNREGETLFCVEDLSSDDYSCSYQRCSSFEACKALFPNATWTKQTAITDADIADMLQAYIECALWSTDGDDPNFDGAPEDNPGGVPLDSNYTENDLSDDCKAGMLADVTAFATKNAQALLACVGTTHRTRPLTWASAGHDFWLTRNGHGAGFWDGDWPEPWGDKLSDACERSEVWLYVGDDGKIHSS